MKTTQKLFITALPVYMLIAFLLGYVLIHKNQHLLQKAKLISFVTHQSDQAPKPIYQIPATIVIPSLNITVPIIKGDYTPQTKKWNVSPDKVQWASLSSPISSSGGNVVIYGHNTKDIFQKLPHLAKKDAVYLITQNNQVISYQFIGKKIVNPEDISPLKETNTPILTLITCTGLFNSKRLIVTFSPTNI